jgi:hypothetical protein
MWLTPDSTNSSSPQRLSAHIPEWLKNVDLTLLRTATASSLAALSLLWGMLSMLNPSTIFVELKSAVPAQDRGEEKEKKKVRGEEKDKEKVFVFEVIVEKLLQLDEQCQSTASRVQCIKTVTLWTTRIM